MKKRKSFGELLEQAFLEDGYVVLRPGEPLPESEDGARRTKARKPSKPAAKKRPKKARSARSAGTG
ncbi:MAG: hypothetical protein HY720_00180 [Planctomycetes bacterium]|nr:hypothetical protein [Planctomycetota bacterium]